MPRFAHFAPHFEALCSMKSKHFVLVEENRNKPRSGGCPNDQLLTEKLLQIVHFKCFRTSGSPSAFRIFKFGDHPLVSNATGHTLQLGLLERLVGACLICSLYAAWFCALVVLDNQHPINLQGIWSWPPLGLLCWTPWLHDTHLSLEQGCLNVLPR